MNKFNHWTILPPALGTALNLNAIARQSHVSHISLWPALHVILAAVPRTVSLLSLRLRALNKSVHLAGQNCPPARPRRLNHNQPQARTRPARIFSRLSAPVQSSSLCLQRELDCTGALKTAALLRQIPVRSFANALRSVQVKHGSRHQGLKEPSELLVRCTYSLMACATNPRSSRYPITCAALSSGNS